MIESLARCLETGGRAALKGNKHRLRSRRHLHSAFWSHGAGNIDLPAWWIFLLQTPVPPKESSLASKDGQFRDVVSSGLQDIFLDFLYPVQTLALIRRLKRSASAHQHAAKSVKRYSRSYTSIAEDFISGKKSVNVEVNHAEFGSTRPQSGDEFRKNINAILDSGNDAGLNDQLWQSYQDLLESSQSPSPQELVKMLRFLTLSKRNTDIERGIALFEGIPIHQRRAIHYSYAVSAALTLRDLHTAIVFHREALSRIKGFIGTAAILRYAIQEESWTQAIDTWHEFWEDRFAYYARPDIWTAVDALPLAELISKASSASDFAISFSKSSDDGTTAAAAREFASELIRRAFNTRGVAFDVDQHWKLIEKAKLLDQSDLSIQYQALIQLLSVDSREHGHRALHLYRILRKNPGFSPTHSVLRAVTLKLIAIQSTSGLSMALEDWQTCSPAMSKQMAFEVARVFARNGHLESTLNLFKDFVSQHGKPKSSSLYHSLLLVYSRRADTEGIITCFNELRENYNFEPGIRAWNIMVSTFSRVGDIDGTLTYFRKLSDAGVRPDSTTYFSLMSMYAKRGDRDAVDELYRQAEAEGIGPTLGMIDTIVLTYVKNGALKEAETLVEQALQMELTGQRTFMWSVLLNAHALRRNVEEVSRLHKRMQEAGVPSNEMTYAALMTSLTVAKFPNAARKILDTVMPRTQIKRTALHYAIVMGGYLASNEPGEIFKLYKDMLRRNINPNMSTQNVLLRAAASVDKTDRSADVDSFGKTELIRARQTFEQTIANLDPAELAATEPRLFAGPNPINEAFTSTYFEYMVFLYGSEGAFTKAIELFDRYIATASTTRDNHQDAGGSPPMRLLSALMVAHINTESWSEVDRCWSLILEKSEKLACKSSSDTFRPNWVLHSRRFLINLPLHQYIKALTHQSRTDDLIDTIHNLQHAGYALNSPNWNTYIQALARSPQVTHHFRAFETCERHLIPSWPGWASFRDPRSLKPKMYAMQRDALLRQDEKALGYLTLVWLARAYLECRNQGKSGLMRNMERAGPRTVDAILNMPRLNDRAQSEILRQEA